MYQEEYLECRDLRHAWWRDNVLYAEPGLRNGVRRVLTCQRCGMHRVDVYVMTRKHIERVGSRYVYPEGYLVPGGMSVEKARMAAFSGMEVRR